MADEIDDLKAQVARQAREIDRLTRENVRRKDQARKLTARLEGREQPPPPSPAHKNGNGDSDPEMDRLKSENRRLKHTEAIRELAYSAEIGISRAVTVDKIMKLMDYAPDKDEFDEKTVKKALTSLVETDPYLRGDQAAAPKSGHAAPLAPGVAALGTALGRGVPPSPIDTQTPTDAELRDPVWMSQYHAQQRASRKK